MTAQPQPRGDGLQVRVGVAGWRGILADPDGRTVWTCPHRHPSVPEASQCAERELQVPGLGHLGARLRQLRQAAGLSQQQAAQALECSTSTVSRLESGQVRASARAVRDLAVLYRADPSERDRLVTVARAGRAARAAWSGRRREHREDHPQAQDRDGAR
jgi:transcriptional regulator with XRE-family HTH domain